MWRQSVEEHFADSEFVYVLVCLWRVQISARNLNHLSKHSELGSAQSGGYGLFALIITGALLLFSKDRRRPQVHTSGINRTCPAQRLQGICVYYLSDPFLSATQ